MRGRGVLELVRRGGGVEGRGDDILTVLERSGYRLFV